MIVMFPYYGDMKKNPITFLKVVVYLVFPFFIAYPMMNWRKIRKRYLYGNHPLHE